MKTLLLIPFLSLSLSLNAQKIDTSNFYLGIYLSTQEGTFTNLQWENDLVISFLRVEYLTNFDDHRLYAKMAFRVYKVKKWQFYVSLPPFHYSHKERGYNTPLNIEVQYKKKWVLNVDGYKDAINVSLQLRQTF